MEFPFRRQGSSGRQHRPAGAAGVAAFLGSAAGAATFCASAAGATAVLALAASTAPFCLVSSAESPRHHQCRKGDHRQSHVSPTLHDPRLQVHGGFSSSVNSGLRVFVEHRDECRVLVEHLPDCSWFSELVSERSGRVGSDRFAVEAAGSATRGGCRIDSPSPGRSIESGNPMRIPAQPRRLRRPGPPGPRHNGPRRSREIRTN